MYQCTRCECVVCTRLERTGGGPCAPAYAVWATGAGFLFGLEYVRDGLGTAAFTHTLYDFLAFGFILVCWPIEGFERELPFEGGGGGGGGGEAEK